MLGFPLLLIPLAVCNIIIFLMPGVSFAAQLFALPLMSGAIWTVTLSDALVTLGLFLLLLEIVKSARPGGKYVTDHLLAMLIFAGAAAEFVMLPQFANATFFLLTAIALVDVLSGIGLRSRRPRRVRETVVAEPAPEPAMVREPPLRESIVPLTPAADPITAEPLPVHQAPPVRVEQIVPARVAPIMDAARIEPIVETKPVLATDDTVKPPGAQS